MSERSLVYRVSVAGQSEFSTALGGIMAQVRKHASDEVAIASAVSRSKRKVKTDQAKFEETLLKTTIAIEKARARDSVKNAEAAEKAKQKAAEAAEKDKTRTVADAAKDRTRIARNAAREEEKALKDSVRYLERIERDKTRAVRIVNSCGVEVWGSGAVSERASRCLPASI